LTPFSIVNYFTAPVIIAVPICKPEAVINGLPVQTPQPTKKTIATHLPPCTTNVEVHSSGKTISTATLVQSFATQPARIRPMPAPAIGIADLIGSL